MPEPHNAQGYRGRLAPSPTGYLHLGHARTFWIAQQRAQAAGGTLVLRNEDLDRARCRPEFVAAMFEDLRWFGLEWQEGPDCSGPFGPYDQSLRNHLYRAALERLREGGFIYPCTCSRKDIQAAARAPHAADDEMIYPGTCRPGKSVRCEVSGVRRANERTLPDTSHLTPDTRTSWRFRVPDGETISFVDQHLGRNSSLPEEILATSWSGGMTMSRPINSPCVVDDAAMRITEVVRGADLLVSTARQLLLYRALGLAAAAIFPLRLMLDETGQRLAKRHDALSLRQLRLQGRTPTGIALRRFRFSSKS